MSKESRNDGSGEEAPANPDKVDAGEGNVEADRRYRKGASEFASDRDAVREAAKKAEEIDPDAAAEAERRGRSKARS